MVNARGVGVSGYGVDALDCFAHVYRPLENDYGTGGHAYAGEGGDCGYDCGCATDDHVCGEPAADCGCEPVVHAASEPHQYAVLPAGYPDLRLVSLPQVSAAEVAAAGIAGLRLVPLSFVASSESVA
ncbi:hypothetical protein V7S43_010777 [Phytophthora oleae]|uniref:Uncharacterized protein n=1 Tax=Phytophthora oleae TaxID=2107226 RepID=A0ABD3FC25_9STRA